MQSLSKGIIGCLFFCLILVGTACGQSQEGEFTPVENPLEVFRLIGNQSQSNYEKIKTWQGEYEIEEINYPTVLAKDVAQDIEAMLPTNFLIVQKGKFKFFIDMRRDSLLVDYRNISVSITDISGVPIVINERSKKLLDSKYLNHRVSIVSPKEILTFEKNELLASFPQLGDREDRVGRVAYRYGYAEDRVVTMATTLVDPRTFFIFGGQCVWDFCQRVTSGKRPLYVKTETNESRIYLNQSANERSKRYQVYTDYIGKNNSVFEHVVEANASFNVTLYSNGLGDVKKGYTPRMRQRNEYKKFDDIFLPSTIDYSLGETKYPNIFRVTRKLKLLNAVVNQPIPKELFTIESLGLEDGDRLRDEIKDQLFEVVDKKIVPVNSVKKTGSNRQRAITLARVMFIVVGIILIVIGTILKVRRKFQRR
ncbi:MAG: hypothetical protein LBJ00_03485 [Planctomycetaceae bacterium]|nr:hypothetical protein [Planctomycetaceae bacterium]